jgi:Type I restriction-modification system methyltransferase subunit
MKKLLQQNRAGGQRRMTQVFKDFCELSALSMRNAVQPEGRDDREARYLAIASGYTTDEMNRFAECMSKVVLALEAKMGDVLGDLYMSLDLGNEAIGQFFTPYDVSRTMAAMTVDPILGELATKPFITMHEPASGSGGMVIALAEKLRDAGFNYQRQIHVQATDIDPTAVHMTYIQLSLLGIPAQVTHGNTLSAETFDVWPTPAHVLGGWETRLAIRDAFERIA